MHTIPFQIASPDAPLLLLQAQVNGQGPVSFVLDTGNGAPVALFVSPSLQRRLGLAADETISAVFPATRLESIEFGDYRLKGTQAAVLAAMDQIGERIGVPIAGNVGYHFLKDWRLEIDYHLCRIALTPSSGSSRDAGVPFETGPGGAFILLPATVNGQGPFRFLVDTGASSTVISPKLARSLGIVGQPIEAMGVQGELTAETLVLDSLEAAGRMIHDLPAASVDVFEFTSQAAGVPVDGVLGYSFLKQFLVVIDYPRKRIAFGRDAGP